MRLTTFLKRLLPWDLLTLGGLASISALASVAHASDSNWFVMDGHQTTIFTEGRVAERQTGLFFVTCWVTLVIFIIVGAILAYATLKFRARSEADEHAEPPAQSHGNPLVEIGLIAASVLALVFIAIPTLKAIWFTYDVPGVETREQLDAKIKSHDAYEITATGLQWWWRFEYPVEQINGAGALTTANELVIPVGVPIRVNVRTMDVIHSFWVPKLAGKVDMVPNRANFLWLQAENPGYYWGQCAEYCGDSHAVMRFRVIALEAKEFAAWRDAQVKGARAVNGPAAAKPQFASLRSPDSWKQNETGFKMDDKLNLTPLDAWKEKQFPEPGEDPALIAKGRTLFQSKTCFTCHTVRGAKNGDTEFVGSPVYPNLTHVGARTTIAGGLLENNPEQLQRWIHNPGAVKPGNKMAKGYIDNKVTLTNDDELALVAFLESLK